MTQPVTTLRNAGVDLGGLMTVLGRHLYSTPVVALRELVQNAHDSIVRRRLETPETPFEPRIIVAGDPVAGTVQVTDNGAGLTEEEIHTYLATVGRSLTRSLRDETGSDELIGMFGLGFLSAFVLATKVTVTTTSCRSPDQTWRYQSSNAQQYSVTAAETAPVGTIVELKLRDEWREQAAPGSLTRVLNRYCALLRAAVFIGAASEPLNGAPPPWRRSDDAPAEHPLQARRSTLAFATRFETRFEPICTMPVAPQRGSDVQGLLWIQDGATYGTSDNRNLSVFVRGMLLDDDARELLPSWAGFVGGVIESNQLTPTASREDLQRDPAWHNTQAALGEALIHGLARIAQEQPEAWRRVITRHNEALLGAALCDPRLFDLLAEALTVPTSQGDLPARALRKNGRVHINLGANGGFEEVLFRALQVPVARGDRYAVLPFLREWSDRRGATMVELGTEQGNRKLFTEASLPPDETAWLTEHLADGERVILARYSPPELPLIVVKDYEVALKRRLESDEADKRIAVAALRMVRGFTATIDGNAISRLYINLDSPAIQHLLRARAALPERAADAAGLLRALKMIMTTDSEAAGQFDLTAALKRFEHAVAILLQ